jgi:acetyltransferase-like isoleucine patch superfamily enzyme
MAFNALYTMWLRSRGVRVGRGCRFLGPVEIVGDPRRITIADRCLLHRDVCLWTHDYGPGHGAIRLGKGAVLARGVTLNSYFEIAIGERSGLGDGCYVQDNDHGTDPGAPFLDQEILGAPIHIGDDVWLGARCLVLKAVTIGDHAVIGAGSVVVRSIPQDVVAVGNPCRPVKQRGVRLPHAA